MATGSQSRDLQHCSPRTWIWRTWGDHSQFSSWGDSVQDVINVGQKVASPPYLLQGYPGTFLVGDRTKELKGIFQADIP